MKVGFTGTRETVTDAQLAAFATLLRTLPGDNDPVTEFHHGCCVGGDEQATEVVHDHDHDCDITIIGHPPVAKSLLSNRAVELSDRLRDPLPYLDRNHAIVDETTVLVACPKGPEELRSGTWAAVRYARKKGRRVVIVWPNGEVTEE